MLSTSTYWPGGLIIATFLESCCWWPAASKPLPSLSPRSVFFMIYTRFPCLLDGYPSLCDGMSAECREAIQGGPAQRREGQGKLPPCHKDSRTSRWRFEVVVRVQIVDSEE